VGVQVHDEIEEFFQQLHRGSFSTADNGLYTIALWTVKDKG
jgi:hypothetical protein